jgi:ATP-dependent DNA helicase RecG
MNKKELIVGEKVGDRLTENQVNIFNFLKNNPQISAKQLALQVGISQRKIEENLAKLKSKDVIDRIGPVEGGRWVVKVNK